MTLNPQVEALLGFFAQMPPVDYETITPEALREANRPMQMGPPPAVAEVRDLTMDLPGRAIAARFYKPEGAGEKAPLTSAGSLTGTPSTSTKVLPGEAPRMRTWATPSSCHSACSLKSGPRMAGSFLRSAPTA